MNGSAASRPPGSSARMADVAELAGVSLKSVSRVINNEPHVTTSLREKVEAAIRELNYVPDPAARSLGGSRTFTVGVLFDNPSPNYTMGVIEGAHSACVQHGYHLRLDHMNSEVPIEDLSAQVERVVRHSRSDGYVLTPPLSDDERLLDLLDRQGVRYVRIAPVERNDRSSYVFIDDYRAAAEVADRLWDLGHRRFGLINGPSRHGASAFRRNGFVETLRAIDPDVRIAEAFGDFNFDAGIKGGRELLAVPDHATAIFVANDDMAAGAMVACAQLGLKVPDDVSIYGFDDSWIAKSVWPYLSTVRQPISAMASRAVHLLLDRNAKAKPVGVKLDFSLIERDSAGPVQHAEAAS